MHSLYHGLSAYNRENSENSEALLSKARTAETTCCSWSDIPIGPIGLFCDPGHITWVDGGCHHDCFSSINEDGFRYTNDRDYIDINDFPSVDNLVNIDDFISHICKKVDINSRKHTQQYAEFFVIAESDAIWVNLSFGKKFLKLAAELSTMMDIPLFLLK